MLNSEIVPFFTPEILIDPYAFYERTRETTPVFKTFLPGQNRDVVIVTSYELVRQVLEDHELYSSDVTPILMGAGRNAEAEALVEDGTGGGPLLLNTDEPMHGRYRALFNPVFSPRQVNQLTPKMYQTMDLLIGKVQAHGECDFINDIAVPFPLYVICDMLGIDRALVPEIKRWTDAILRRVGQQETGEAETATMREIAEFHEFVRAEFALRRAEPRDDLITEILNVRVDGSAPLTDREALLFVQELCVAGNETTRNTLIGGLGILLKTPGAIEALRRDRNLIPAAVEEILRLFSPVAGTWRIATQATTLGGVEIPEGAVVMVRMESANRDPAQFPNPDQLDLTRRNRNTHLTFSFGVHYCLGNMLARRELVIALEKILELMPDLQMVEETSDLGRPPSVMLRGNNALHVRFTPSVPRAA